jgi:hypothetical protein
MVPECLDACDDLVGNVGGGSGGLQVDGSCAGRGGGEHRHPNGGTCGPCEPVAAARRVIEHGARRFPARCGLRVGWMPRRR